MKKAGAIICILIICISASIGTSKQSEQDFEQFISKFNDFHVPIVPPEFILEKGVGIKNMITKSDYDKYLRKENDTFWIFDDYHVYYYGGKMKLDTYWLVFYTQSYIPDSIDLQRDESVLSTFTLDGRKISSQPIAVSLGDSITSIVKINTLNDIVTYYTKYTNGNHQKYTVLHYVDKNGYIKQKKD